MALPLPFAITDPVTAEGVQANFDAIKNEFPLSRKNMVVEAAKVVGAADQPAFQNSWVNFDTATFHGLRFWKDALGMVHIEGMVKDGVIGTTIFTLPAGYRPSSGHRIATVSNSLFGYFDVAPTGNVVAAVGSNLSFTVNAHFKWEQ